MEIYTFLAEYTYLPLKLCELNILYLGNHIFLVLSTNEQVIWHIYSQTGALKHTSTECKSIFLI